MTTLKTNCESCKKSIAYPVIRAGSPAKCPGCQASLTLPDVPAKPIDVLDATEPPTRQPVATMPTIEQAEPFASVRQYAGSLFYFGWVVGFVAFLATAYGLMFFSLRTPEPLTFIAVAFLGMATVAGGFMIVVASELIFVFLAIERNTRQNEPYLSLPYHTDWGTASLGV